MATGREIRIAGAWLFAFAAAVAACLAFGAAAEAKPLKTAIVQVRFANAPGEELGGVEEARATLHDGPKSVSAFMDYITGGRVTLAGRDHARAEVYGPYTIPSQNAVGASCNANTWAEQALAEAKKAGANVEGYDRIIFGLPRIKMNCGWDGLAHTPGPWVWQNGNWAFGVLAHEIGHTFGWTHAGRYVCKADGQPVSLAPAAQCTTHGGGDPWELMGVGASRTPSAFRLLQAEFLDRDQRQIVTKSGEYTISPMQPVRGTGTKLLRIPRNGKSTLDLEFRRPDASWDNYEASDPVVNGITARIGLSDRAPGATGPGGTTALVDTKPATEIFNDAPLAAGQTLEDPETGIKVTTKSVGPEGAVVDVQLPFTPDLEAPTKPTNLQAKAGYAASPTSTTAPVRLTWTASTDDVGVEGYRVFRNGTLIGTTNGATTTFTDPGADKAKWAFYNVEAFDRWGYASGHSAHAAVSVGEPPYAPRVDVSFPAGDPKVVLSAKTQSDTPLNPTIFERDGANLGFRSDHRLEDRNVQAGKTYRYGVKAYTIYGVTGPTTTCEVTVPGSGSQGGATCTAPDGVPMTPKGASREGGPLGPEEPFFPRAGHAWSGTGEGAPAFWVDGHHIEHWAFTNTCPGGHVPNSVVFSNRHIRIRTGGSFRYHGQAMQQFANGREHATRVLFEGRLHHKTGTVTVEDEHPGCHFDGEGTDGAGAAPAPRTYKVSVVERPVSAPAAGE
jgi:hypothetical protein